MTNFERFEKVIKAALGNETSFAYDAEYGSVMACLPQNCSLCAFKNGGNCEYQKMVWLYSEEEQWIINEEELRLIDKVREYDAQIGRTTDGKLTLSIRNCGNIEFFDLEEAIIKLVFNNMLHFDFIKCGKWYTPVEIIRRSKCVHSCELDNICWE